ncbi:MAG: S8 family serine peptidase, partial [Candidatus Thorarchaeota archaeon]
DVISFSSRGPSPGSRVKPEVIAPGTHIQGTASTNAGYTGNSVCDQYRPSGQTVFAASSGTSHSTPAVAGVVSLAYYWMENTYSTTPSPALMKAYLIAHPTYLTGVSANDTLPSNSQGYGMPNMSLIFDDASKYLVNQSVLFDNSGETWTWDGSVSDPTKPVRIVLAYTDAPGAIGTSPQVNDLNLAAYVAGSTYMGNVFSGQWSTTGGSADPFNNYEAIYLPAGTDGVIEISVTGFNIAGDGVPNTGDGTDQDFALVCYNCTQTPTFSLNVTPDSLDVCAPADAIYDVAVGSVLGYVDPVTLSASGNPAGTTVGFSVNPVMPPGSSTMTIGSTGSGTAGSYSIDLTGTATAGTKTRVVDLNLFDIVPAGPTLLTPADGALGAPFKPTFSWTAVAQASNYLLEVATDAGFTNIVYTASETGTSHSTAIPLSADTTYYWHVSAGNVCGSGASAAFSFTTQAATMLCNGSLVEFEDGIPPDWTVVDNTGGTGIVWTTTADPACEIPNRTNGSGEAACADSDAAGTPATPYETELVSNPFDLSAQGGAVLDVKAYYRDITTNGNDRFEVDVWDGVSWTNELSWDEDHEPEDFALNLSAYAGLPTVQVRFRYFGNGFDWFAQVDDIALTCVPPSPPVIEVDPAALTESQGPNIVSTQPMTITNSGGNPLNWNIVEDDSACDSPTDIPWLSVAPDTGTTIPLESTVVDVIFDSAGLAPGDYSANLCVDSNDTATGIVQVPVYLTVEPAEVLVCSGAMIQFEDGIPSGWQVVDNTGGTGIVWVTTADPACEIPNRTNGSGEAACADSDAAGTPATPYDTELWTPLIDLSGQGAVVLDVKAYYNDITTNGNDRFEV